VFLVKCIVRKYEIFEQRRTRRTVFHRLPMLCGESAAHAQVTGSPFPPNPFLGYEEQLLQR
jgi:hypothetical protein